MKPIIIKTVPKDEIRNDGVGDYKITKNGVEILVAKQKDPDEEYGIAVHELHEVTAAMKAGVSLREIDKFDRKNIKSDQPGDIPKAPYHKQHKSADKIEKLAVREIKKFRKRSSRTIT